LEKCIDRFDKDAYFSLDNRENLKDFDIDTVKRKLPLWQPFKHNLVFETELILPAGKVVSDIPSKVQVKKPKYSFEASYSQAGGKLTYRNEIIINSADINPREFSQWNADIKQLTVFYNQQLMLKPL
jgi:hypothetical protein